VTAAASPTHPRGLYTLFFTEMWERFSYYGMRALLILFLTDKMRGGLGMSIEVASAIYGLYTASVYLASLPGGWVADRVLGQQSAVFTGGIIIAAGHFTMALEQTQAFYLGLILIVMGTGLLKPNISAIVGDLYPEGGARRDAGFTIFYMGINLGAAIGPLVCGYLAQNQTFGRWQYGFAAAGVGMVLGVIQFHLTKRHLGPPRPIEEPLRSKSILYFVLAAVLVIIGLALSGVIKIDPVRLAKGTTYAIVGIAVVYFLAVFLFFKLTADEKRRMWLIVVLFVSSAIFWSGFEQAGSSLNVFGDSFTNRNFFGSTIPSSWFQSINSIFIITLAPFIAAFWVNLALRNLEPSIPTKFGLGLIFMALGFATMAVAAAVVLKSGQAGPQFLIITYFLHTVGELCLSPVGLSSITKLAPRRLVGQMMGVWFTATSLGNLMAGLLAGEMATAAEMRNGFWKITILPTIVGIILIAGAKMFNRSGSDSKA
jgi:proton-dependent oligopeptide transporter, POT family